MKTIFRRKDISKGNNSFFYLKKLNNSFIYETLYLPQANTKQKWIEIYIFFVCLLALFAIFCFVVCFKVLCTNPDVRYWQITSNPLIAEDLFSNITLCTFSLIIYFKFIPLNSFIRVG